MNRRARLVPISVAVSLLTGFPLFAQEAEVPRTHTLPGIESPAFPYEQPEEIGLSSEKLKRLGNEITEWVANGDLIGAELLIVKSGRAVFHEAYGWSDREERRPMERNSIFSIKSMTKPLVATAILMLADEGKLSLNDPVSRYLPGFAGDERATVRDLLAHTSGFEGLGGNINSYDSFREWVEGWGAREPTRPFGEFSYSDFNYAALGYVIEAVSGVPADAFLEDRIIGPLGLDETRTAFDPDAPWATRANSRYRWDEEAGDYERYWTRRERQEWNHFPAAWGVWGTAMDYAEFMVMWLNRGRYEGTALISTETVEEALAPHGFSNGSAEYGYGWFVETPEKAGALPSAFGHGGIDGTLARAFPADNAVVIFLTHSRYPGNLSAFGNRLAMLGLLQYGGPGPGMVWADAAGVDEVTLPSDRCVPYLGIYRGRFPGWRRRSSSECGRRATACTTSWEPSGSGWGCATTWFPSATTASLSDGTRASASSPSIPMSESASSPRGVKRWRWRLGRGARSTSRPSVPTPTSSAPTSTGSSRSARGGGAGLPSIK